MRISLQTAAALLLIIALSAYWLIPNTRVGGIILFIGSALAALGALYVIRQNRNKDR